MYTTIVVAQKCIHTCTHTHIPYIHTYAHVRTCLPPTSEKAEWVVVLVSQLLVNLNTILLWLTTAYILA